MFAVGSLVARTALVAAIALPLLAQSGNPASQAPPSVGTGSISGTVTEVGSNTPIGDAIVFLSAPGDPTRPRTIATDDTGQFVFHSLPKGVYRLRVEADGFVATSLGQDRPNPIDRAQDASLLRTLELADGEALKGTTLRMWRKAGVGGFVGDDVGEPVVGVRVSVIARVADWTGVRMRVAAAVTTDDRGLYHADVQPGEYIVGLLGATTTASAGWASGAEIPYLFAPRVGNGGRVGDRLVSTLPGGLAAMPGVSTMPGISDAAPPRLGADGQLWTCPTTFYPMGSSPAQARVLSLRSGEERTGVDLTLAPQPTRRVSGRIDFFGESVGGSLVELISSDAVSARDGAITALEAALSSSDQAGAFVLIGIPAGDYLLRAVHMDEAGETKGWGLERVAVQNDVTNVTVTLHPLAPIEGAFVAVNSAGAAPQAASPPSIRISAVPTAGSAGAISRSIGSAFADLSKPQFWFSVIPGDYVFNVTTPAGWYTKSITVDGRDGLERPITIKPSGAKEILVTVTDGPASISGVARTVDGTGEPYAAVVVFPADPAWVTFAGSQSQRLKTVPAGRTGAFRITGLPPGDYCLIATTGTTPDFMDPAVRTFLAASATRITLHDRDAATRDAPVVVIR